MNRCKRAGQLRQLREHIVSEELRKRQGADDFDDNGVLLPPTEGQLDAAHTVADALVREFRGRRSNRRPAIQDRVASQS